MKRSLLLWSMLLLATASRAQLGEHTLNLKDADIRVFITTISEITGKSFIVDPRVEGKVNVISSKPMQADEVYQVFESVLRVNGFAAIRSGSMIKIVPEAVAKQDGDAGASSGPDSLTTKVIDLKYVAAAELLPILNQLVPQAGQIAVHASSNSLVITDRTGNLTRLESIIRRIDQASDASIEVIPLQHANATELTRTLTLLTDDKAAGANGQPSKVFDDARTNSILLSGDRAARLRMRTLISHLDTPLQSGENTQVVYLRYAKAQDLVSILEQTANTLTEQSTAKDAAKNATIQAHQETNALVITAAPTVFRALQSVIRQLDVRRAQVLIEGIIAEVSDELVKELGVQWQSTNLDVDAEGNLGRGYLGGTNFPGQNGIGGILGAAVNPLSVGSGLNLGYVGGSITLPGSDRPILQIGALVRAIGGDGRSNLLSTPSLVTLDNAEAEFSVGQEVPFIQGEFTTGVQGGNNASGAIGNPFRTIQREEVGLKLIVTPHINEGDSVLLDIKQEVSSIAANSQGAVDLVTNKRTLNTSVMVPDNTMLVLGGLISSEVRESISKVPMLGDIPVVGNLFRHRSSNVQKRNLMIFLKPTILRDAATEQAVSTEKYNFIRAEQLKMRGRKGQLTPKQEQPLLPEADWRPPMQLAPETPGQ